MLLTAVILPGIREVQRDCNLLWWIGHKNIPNTHRNTHLLYCTNWRLVMQRNNQSSFWATLAGEYARINKWFRILINEQVVFGCISPEPVRKGELKQVPDYVYVGATLWPKVKYFNKYYYKLHWNVVQTSLTLPVSTFFFMRLNYHHNLKHGNKNLKGWKLFLKYKLWL